MSMMPYVTQEELEDEHNRIFQAKHPKIDS
jgi:hypothetical protein